MTDGATQSHPDPQVHAFLAAARSRTQDAVHHRLLDAIRGHDVDAALGQAFDRLVEEALHETPAP